ncbi:uncharacterized protein LOC131617678 [Vicia villosa]|uniref:uncharacterized protein LOC131617678 n=1 Tax=Vicia villosa TaxID=3911 RepID=UPI00273C0672|nr:uncharacterized protein LOC131617678 [Vicia villosa]
MNSKLSIFLCFYALLLVFVVTTMPLEDVKQYDETIESKTNIGINRYIHNAVKFKIWKGMINYFKGRKVDDPGNVIKFPSGGRWGYGGKAINTPDGGKGGGGGNIITFPGVEEESDGGNVGNGG